MDLEGYKLKLVIKLNILVMSVARIQLYSDCVLIFPVMFKGIVS